MSSYHDYIEKLNRPHLMLFPDDEISPNDPVDSDRVILLITHDFTRTGGPSVLLDAATVMKDLGYTLFVLSTWEGELLPDYMALGCTIILYPSYRMDLPWVHTLTELFPLIFANTLMTLPAVRILAPDAKHLFWWLHESSFMFNEGLKEIELHGDGLYVLAAGEPVIESVRSCFGTEASLFPFYVEDVRDRYPVGAKDEPDVLRFLHVGTVDKNKGQLLLIDAIRALPADVLKRVSFSFVANLTKDADMEIYRKMKDIESTFPCVHVLEGMPKEALYWHYANTDVVIVSSYQETTSAVAVEALMMERLLLCSDSAGICHYLHNGDDALLFHAGDAHSLRQTMIAVTEPGNNFSTLRRAGRQIYQSNYSADAFRARMSRLLS